MPSPNLIIIDNFYPNPMEIRELALRSAFDVVGNFPGKRTLPIYCNDHLGNIIASIMGSKIICFGGDSNGAFQITTEKDQSWIHSDDGAMWAGVLYLTLNPPENSGTVFYKHKKSGSITYKEGLENTDGNNSDLWEMTDRIANVFNRLILYRGNMWHKSDKYFGDNLENGRLFQVFFFEVSQ